MSISGNKPGGNPAISVIIPFYNAEEYLKEAAGSVLDHDFEKLELLMVDDASTDRSLEIARNLQQMDPRVRIITHGTNQGAGPARNSGV